MISHAWTVVCEKSIIDKETNNISLDVLEQLNIQTPPLPDDAPGFILPAPIQIVSLWYLQGVGNGARGRAQTRFLAPNGEQVGKIEFDIDLTQHRRSRTRGFLSGLPIPRSQSGWFQFVVELELENKWVEVARVPLEIIVAHSERASEVAPPAS